MRHRTPTAACLVALGVACAASAYSQVVIDQPWVRSTVPGQTVASAYMDIRSSTQVSLARASTPMAKSAELHQTRMTGDIVSMRAVENLEVPAGKTVSLKPGGYHLMLVDIARPLAKGDVVPLTLVFEEKGKPAQTVEVKAEVRSLFAQSHEQHGKKAADRSSAKEQPFGREGDPKKATRTIDIGMSDKLRFAPAELTVKQGETVRFRVRNSGQTMHEMVLGRPQDLKEHAEMMRKHPGMHHDEPHMAHVAPGKTGTLVWQFTKPGEFRYGCLVPGHFEAGMIGKIVVK